MTVIAAITDGENTWIGSDRLTILGSQRTLLTAGKWVLSGGWAMAMPGATRYRLAVTRAAGDLFSHIDPADMLEFSASLAAVFRAVGIRPAPGDDPDNDGCEYWHTGGFLARRGKLWEFDNSLTFNELPADKLFAGGIAWKFAEGAAWALAQHIVPKAAPDLLVRKAIACACALDPANCESLWQERL